ncbi:AzlC family ABC transporter permease [Pannonibacter phragmitetus]|uniref:AzlC family ABC transporter permease n=3 Tax=Pannonibacter phragmitetus TaxID=121719 RepID=UPI000AB288D0|nr:AzlC family ABC transporter permease [Pannonibacter phragmitetus]
MFDLTNDVALSILSHMRTIFQTLTRRDWMDVLLVCGATTIAGVSFGAIATGGGLPFWVPLAMSTIVFAGASQFAAVGVVLAGGGPVAAVLAGLVLNARHLPFGFSVAGLLRGGLLQKLLGSHLLTDEALAFSLKDSNPERARALYWACAIGLYVLWNVGTFAGALLGQAVGDASALGLDAAFPAVLLALVLPALKDARLRLAAGLGAAIAFVLTPVLPAGVPVLAALCGLVVFIVWPRTVPPEGDPAHD